MSEHALHLNPQQIAELSLVDLAYQVLRTTNKPYHFRDLMAELARLKGLTEEQVNEVIARLYTEINIDGRFVCIGSNVWGLKRWYPTDKAAPEKAATGKKFVRKDMDDDDDFYDEEDDSFEEEADEDDSFGDYSADEEDDLDADAEDGDDEAAADEDFEEDEIEESDEEEDLDSYDEEEDEF
ncbi:DNA-directed RNA polymerase subunit delta [Tumebacillus algifaecis]|uniref:Probable DNA-directed RNA polymerase subunit delta n=1 Tax=Tumebacillus algifaecis TaxID=1214604 RepID=A0A223D5X5_9BACL|nr:DNA-directed RNA polymerase subunit delta [Tumebacillus algifaecis]ASS76992.1 DNA-directed RNA polymerase subunit delta [Tumebacillus algifaecis]